MPYVETHVSKSIQKKEKEIIKEEVASILDKIAGKGEKYLMINIKDKQDMYFGGEKGEYAYIEVRLLGELTKDQKKNITLEIGNIFEKKINIGKENIYITFKVYDRENWGYNGKLF